MAGQIYMATREYGAWVPCPRVNMEAGKVGWDSIAKYLNGGNYLRRSTAAAKEYALEWGLKSRDELRPILDFADRVYGTGDIYFLDPFAMDKNVLPSYWAAPFQNSIDGPLVDASAYGYPYVAGGIVGTSTVRPASTVVGSVNGYPVQTGGSIGTHKLFIPCPPGYRMDFGVHHASGFGGFVSIQRMIGGAALGSPTVPVMLTTATSTRFNYGAGFGDTDFNAGYEITMTGSTVYTGMMAQIRALGSGGFSEGGFISGQGHSGLQFAEQPTYYEYSSALDKVQASAKLIEVGAWR